MSPLDTSFISTTVTPTGLPVRILCFDGGSIRGGLSSLLILREIMEKMAVANSPSKEDAQTVCPPTPRPSECFDLIIGSGTGGISALFLGRLKMTVDEAIAAYQEVAKVAFEPPSFLSRALQRLWPSRKLESCIGDIVLRFLNDRNAPLCDPAEGYYTCRTAVLACTSGSTSVPPHVFRSYATSESPSPLNIVDVARAAIAMEGMDPVSLGNPAVQFISTVRVGYNNPAMVASKEITEIWPDHFGLVCLVSLGTGLQKPVPIGEDLIKPRESIAQSRELVHERMQQTSHHMKMEYFRFNVPQGVSDVDIHELTPSGASLITRITEGYICDGEVDKSLQYCARTLTMVLSNVAANDGIGKYLPLQNPAPKIFHGRQEYVDITVALLVNQPTARFAILGPGGIGKTSIALTILHATAIKDKFGEHVRFVSCDGVTSTASLVDNLCVAFDLCGNSGDRLNGLLIHLKVTYTSRPLLLVLDNFETVWDVGGAKYESEALLQALEQVPLLSLIVTLRGTMRPAGVQWTKPFLNVVERLDPAAAHHVFLDICGKEDDEMLDQLLLALDYVPLAITLMARQSLSLLKPGQLLKMWNKEKTNMLSNPSIPGRMQNLNASIHTSICSPRMKSTPGALKLLSILALLPGGVHIDDLTVIAPKLEECDLAFLTLLSVGLAQLNSMSMLQVLSPIRAYITQYHKPSAELLKDMQSYFFTLAELGKVEPGDAGYHAAIVKLKNMESNMEAILTSALETGEDAMHCLEAALNWTRFLLFQTPRSDIIELALRLAERQQLEIMLARCLQSLGEIKHRLNHFDEAQQILSKAQTMFERIGDRPQVAECLWHLGEIQRLLDHYDEAQQILHSAQITFATIGDQRGIARCLKSLGNIQYILDHYGEAQAMLSEAQSIFEAIQDQVGAAQCLQSLGNIQYMLDEYSKAQQMLSDAQARFEAVGDEVDAARCLQNLGNIQYMLEHYDVAEQMLSDAQTRLEVMGDQMGAAQCLHSLGNQQYMLGNYDNAQQKLSDALTKFKAMGNQHGAAQCLQSLGYIQYMLNHYDGALLILSEAQAKFEAIQNQYGAAKCLKLLGDTSKAQTRTKEAVMYFTQSKEAFAHAGSHTLAEQEECGVALAELS